MIVACVPLWCPRDWASTKSSLFASTWASFAQSLSKTNWIEHRETDGNGCRNTILHHETVEKDRTYQDAKLSPSDSKKKQSLRCSHFSTISASLSTSSALLLWHSCMEHDHYVPCKKKKYSCDLLWRWFHMSF